MSLRLKPQEFEKIRQFILDNSGIKLAEGKGYLIENRLGDLAAREQCQSFNELIQKAQQPGKKALKQQIIDRITTNETLWFRDNHPFTVLEKVLLPAYAQELAQGKRRKVRIWSAAASTGQEPYSIAIVIQEFIRQHPQLNLKPYMFEILGTDISQDAIAAAKEGLYNKVALSRGLPAAIRQRYFTDKSEGAQVNSDLRQMVRFQTFNLLDSFSGFSKFDIIFCRYVAIYFAAEFKKTLYQKIAQTLQPGGYLFVGSSEALIGHSTAFERLSHQGAIYYRLK